MTDIVERLRDPARVGRTPARWADIMSEAADEIERLRVALLTAEGMLSEMNISSAEKCQMAYDYLHETRAALKEGER